MKTWEEMNKMERLAEIMFQEDKERRNKMKDFIIMLKILIWFVVLLFVSTHIFTEPTNLYWLILIVIAFISIFMGIN